MRVAAASPLARSLPEGAPESGPAPARAEPDLLRVLGEDGRAIADGDPAPPPEALLTMYREMVRARLVDAAMIDLQRQGRVPSYIAAEGQEAVSVGAACALERTDWIFPAFRENAVLLARGFSLDRFVAQLLGNAFDAQQGRQAPGYMSARSLHVVSTSSAVATQLPHAVGVAWAARRNGSATVALAFAGDGATSSGDFHAALNFAAVFRAPCIVVVQNNQWAMSTPSARQTAAPTFAIKGKAYGVPSLRVDGGDVLAVHRAVASARARAVSGGGPTLIECVTSHARAWRAPGESSEGGKGGDPIERLGRHLTVRGLLDETVLPRLEAEVTREIAQAVDRGEALPAPDRASLFDDVYAARPWHLEDQARALGRR